MLKILLNSGTKVQEICLQAKLKIQAALSDSIEKIKACVKIIFAACANAPVSICGLGQAGHKAIVVITRESETTLDGTFRKTSQPQVNVQAEAVKAEVVEITKPAPVLSKMDKVKQAVKNGSATVGKAVKDHPRIYAAVIAVGMFGVSKALEARASSNIAPGQLTEEEAIVAAAAKQGIIVGIVAGAVAGTLSGAATAGVLGAIFRALGATPEQQKRLDQQ